MSQFALFPFSVYWEGQEFTANWKKFMVRCSWRKALYGLKKPKSDFAAHHL